MEYLFSQARFQSWHFLLLLCGIKFDLWHNIECLMWYLWKYRAFTLLLQWPSSAFNSFQTVKCGCFRAMLTERASSEAHLIFTEALKLPAFKCHSSLDIALSLLAKMLKLTLTTDLLNKQEILLPQLISICVSSHCPPHSSPFFFL